MVVARTGSTTELASLALRGSNPDEVLIYVDGVPLNIAEGGGVDISTLPLGDVERVEVYRGTTPLAFGESALGGVVSIVTRTPGTTRAQARAAVGSFGTMFGDLSAGGRVGRLRLYLGGHVYSSQGDYPITYNLTPTNPANEVHSRRQNNDALEGNGVLRLALTLTGRRTLSLGAIGFGREQGLPGPAQQSVVDGPLSQRARARVPAVRVPRRSRPRGTALGAGLRERRTRPPDRSRRGHRRAGARGVARDDRLDGRDRPCHASARRLGTGGRRARDAARDVHPERRARSDDLGRCRPGGWLVWPVESSTCVGNVWTFT